MTARITVVTAAHEPNFQYLDTAYQSLLDQDVLDWEWVVQVDGEGVPSLPKDKRVHTANNRPSGPGATRNMALAHATAPVVRTLDADDALLPGALRRDLDTFDEHPEIGWCVSPALDLHPDGSTSRWDRDDPPPGILPVGWVEQQWVSNGWVLPVLPSTMAMRRSLLMAAGGWMALPTSEDTGLLLAAGALAPGWFHSEPGNLYRKHADQLTKSIGHLDPATSEQRHRLILERVAELRRILR